MTKPIIHGCSKPQCLSDTRYRCSQLLDAYAALDQSVIQHLAFDFIAQLSDEALNAIHTLSPQHQRHRLTMEVFYASMLTWAVEKSPEVEMQVEDDIDLWIEANAPAIVAANVERITTILSPHGLDWREYIDCAFVERQQQQALQATWAIIEGWIEPLLKTEPTGW